jgi:hypothetical protein
MITLSGAIKSSSTLLYIAALILTIVAALNYQQVVYGFFEKANPAIPAVDYTNAAYEYGRQALIAATAAFVLGMIPI